MAQKKKLPILILLVVGFLFIMANKTKGSSRGGTTAQKSGFQKIHSVQGVEFQINQPIVDKATAVAQISKDSEFVASDFYSYTDGENKYILFCMDRLVVACEKGTGFNFAGNKNDVETLKNHTLMGIWFDKESKKLQIKKKGAKTDADVTGQVAITTDLFGDFTGKLVTLNNGGEEWALFVGCPGTKYDNLPKKTRKAIEAISETFAFSQGLRQSEPEYEFTISGDTVSGMTISDNITVSESKPKKKDTTKPSVSMSIAPGIRVSFNAISGNTVSGDAVSGNTISGNTVSSDSVSGNRTISENIIESEEVIIETFPDEGEEETSEEAEEVTETSIEEEEEATEEPKEEVRPAEGTKPKGLNVSNESSKKADKNKVHNSSLGSLLNVGYMSISSVYTGTQGAPIEGVTVRLSSAGPAGDDHPEKTYALPQGCHWEKATFDIAYDSVPHYIDTRLIGADGRNLKFRGVKYSMRTYDNKKDLAANGNIITHTVFYAVPNGCPDYILKIGGTSTTNAPAAYYHIKTKGTN